MDSDCADTLIWPDGALDMPWTLSPSWKEKIVELGLAPASLSTHVSNSGLVTRPERRIRNWGLLPVRWAWY
jgi:hypothetical protein